MTALKPTPAHLDTAARIIRNGGVVVMPTETVYGLACNALDAAAVRRVFEIKGRPNENPLIVHLSSVAEIGLVASSVAPLVQELAERFWPGPLTVVLPKKPVVPYETTAGLDTVAVRVPAHPDALALIERCGVPLAAPSANLFSRLSPTRAEDVDPEIASQVDMVLDGGPCEVGVESTVLDLTGSEPVVLRPGNVTRADIQAVLGRPLGVAPPPLLRKSPGLYRRHYAPRAAVLLVERLRPSQAGLTFGPATSAKQQKMPDEPRAYAAALYVALKRLDDLGCEEIGIEMPPNTAEWEAVLDRLKKASAR